MQVCMHENLDFLVITGDFFDVNVPDLSPVKRAAEMLRRIRDNGTEIYMIYGSHDFNASTISMIDILHSAGLFIKPVEFEQTGEGKMRLRLINDKKTNIRIAGLSGRKNSLDTEYYQLLDQYSAEYEEGPKIFLFHTLISELTPNELAHNKTVPMSLLPRGFMYYGGGHLHKRVEYMADDKKSAIIYPGPLFGSTFTDLENTATGEKRGFYIIEYDTESRTVEPLFMPIKLADIDLKVVDANGLTSKQTEDKISKIIKELDPVDKIFLLKVKGRMSMGRRSDIEFGKFEEEISRKGALISFINRSNLYSAESVGIKIPNRETNIENIEKTVIKERISSYKIDPSLKDKHAKEFVHSRLFSSGGENTADQLLRILKTEKLENETQRDYERRIISDVTSTVEI